MPRIITDPGLPAFDTPAFWKWLECYHARHNGHVRTHRDPSALETRLHETLVPVATPPGVRLRAGEREGGK